MNVLTAVPVLIGVLGLIGSILAHDGGSAAVANVLIVVPLLLRAAVWYIMRSEP